MGLSLDADPLVLVGAVLLVVGVIAAGLAGRLGVPGMLLFLGLGMAIGDDGLDWISFSDFELAQTIGVVLLVVILFEGGLTTTLREVRAVGAPAGLLATFGVALTAVVLAAAAAPLLGVDATTALLVGAVLASTDAAAMFSILRHAPLPRRVAALLKLESGGNDPVAVLLTVGVLEAWRSDPSALDWVAFGSVQLVGGLLVGLVVGVLGAALEERGRWTTPVLAAVGGIGIAGLAYGLATLVGASGFLATYVAGIVVAERAPRLRRSIRTFHEGLAAAAEIALFLLLGLLVFPAELEEVIGPAIALGVVLLLVARPAAVFTLVPWFGFARREVLFSAWAGLRGAAPIVLATFPLVLGHPEGPLVFDVVFVVVLLSALTQGTTLSFAARKLDLHAEPPAEPLLEAVPLDAPGIAVFELDVPDRSCLEGVALRDHPPPGGARVMAVVRGEDRIVPDGDTVIACGDRLVVAGRPGADVAGELKAWAAPRHP